MQRVVLSFQSNRQSDSIVCLFLRVDFVFIRSVDDNKRSMRIYIILRPEDG